MQGKKATFESFSCLIYGFCAFVEKDAVFFVQRLGTEKVVEGKAAEEDFLSDQASLEFLKSL